eukprot:TRINITY_DN41888_c0_g1_i1.p1 TRINITY_DN41888_c0_g1~~TRINITY_DN41888_c0_g1_i1.p1  ORF type:complete len:945 (-),score=170.49 TRINITY_DN41888_c0_g1_i1:339-3173(-)
MPQAGHGWLLPDPEAEPSRVVWPGKAPSSTKKPCHEPLKVRTLTGRGPPSTQPAAPPAPLRYPARKEVQPTTPRSVTRSLSGGRRDTAAGGIGALQGYAAAANRQLPSVRRLSATAPMGGGSFSARGPLTAKVSPRASTPSIGSGINGSLLANAAALRADGGSRSNTAASQVAPARTNTTPTASPRTTPRQVRSVTASLVGNLVPAAPASSLVRGMSSAATASEGRQRSASTNRQQQPGERSLTPQRTPGFVGRSPSAPSQGPRFLVQPVRRRTSLPGDQSPPPLQAQAVCSCGNAFLVDSNYCRKCGQRRRMVSSSEAHTVAATANPVVAVVPPAAPLVPPLAIPMALPLHDYHIRVASRSPSPAHGRTPPAMLTPPVLFAMGSMPVAGGMQVQTRAVSPLPIARVVTQQRYGGDMATATVASAAAEGAERLSAARRTPSPFFQQRPPPTMSTADVRSSSVGSARQRSRQTVPPPEAEASSRTNREAAGCQEASTRPSSRASGQSLPTSPTVVLRLPASPTARARQHCDVVIKVETTSDSSPEQSKADWQQQRRAGDERLVREEFQLSDDGSMHNLHASSSHASSLLVDERGCGASREAAFAAQSQPMQGSGGSPARSREVLPGTVARNPRRSPSPKPPTSEAAAPEAEVPIAAESVFSFAGAVAPGRQPPGEELKPLLEEVLDRLKRLESRQQEEEHRSDGKKASEEQALVDFARSIVSLGTRTLESEEEAIRRELQEGCDRAVQERARTRSRLTPRTLDSPRSTSASAPRPSARDVEARSSQDTVLAVLDPGKITPRQHLEANSSLRNIATLPSMDSRKQQEGRLVLNAVLRKHGKGGSAGHSRSGSLTDRPPMSPRSAEPERTGAETPRNNWERIGSDKDEAAAARASAAARRGTSSERSPQSPKSRRTSVQTSASSPVTCVMRTSMGGHRVSDQGLDGC